ncbi:MAG: hypothetical protein HXY28_11040 [Hydrogenophilaceae bacterium]|nr:hypothetical protein [Hydrogenophilaceae bacterium]
MGRSQTFVLYACANWGAAGLGLAACWARLPAPSALVLAAGAMLGATYCVTPQARRGQRLRIAATAGAAMASIIVGAALGFMVLGAASAVQAAQLSHSSDPNAYARLLMVGADNEANMLARGLGFGAVIGLAGFWFNLPRVAPQPTAEEQGPPAWTKML